MTRNVTLVPKRKVFIEEYLTCWNATEAARRAGYKHPAQQGSALTKLEIVERMINNRIAELAVSSGEVLKRLGEQARSDIGDFLDDDGSLNMAKARAMGKTHLIKSVTRSIRGTRIELYSSQAALELLGRNLGLFMDRLEHSGPGGAPIETRDVSDPDSRPVALLLALYERVRERITSQGSDEESLVDASSGASDDCLLE